MANTNNIPSERELEAIANSIFKSYDFVQENSVETRSPATEQKDLPLGLNNNTLEREFNIEQPQTSLQDPFFEDGKVPNAVAGSGRSPNQENLKEFSAVIPSYDRQDAPFNYGHGVGDNLSSYSNKGTNNLSNFEQSNFGKFPVEHKEIFSSVLQPTDNVPYLEETLRSYADLISPFSEKSSFLQEQVDPKNHPFLTNTFVGLGNNFGGVGSNVFKRDGVFDVQAVRKDFPILQENINGHRLVWFDNAATTQKPQSVIDRLSYFYKHENSNIHRAAHELAARATDAYEGARETIKSFINANSVNEIVFTRGTTESINLIASSWGEQNLGEGDEIIISNLEHHANIVPWQLLSQKKGFKINVIPVNDQGELLLEEYAKLLNRKTKLVSFTHVSNALGTITPAKTIISLAHQAGAKVLLDGAQSISHIKVDVQDLDPDFFVFSGHKIFGPTGIGVVYGKEALLNVTQPYQGGGNMIKDVTFEKTIFHPAPNRFEAGTGNIADAVGLAAAIEYVQRIGIDKIAAYEHELLDYATNLFHQIPGVKLIGTAKEKTSVMSFTLKGYSNEEVGKLLNEYGIAVRTGHHCAQPILRRLGYESSVRPSFAFYNTFEEIDLLANVISKASSARR